MPKVIRSNSLASESIRLMANCPVCHKQYGQTNAKLIEEVEDAHLLHICCTNCSSAVLALVFTTGFGITSMGLLTDLNSDDVKNIRRNGVVSDDDILEMYQYLQKEKVFSF